MGFILHNIRGLNMKIKVRNMISERSGRPVANQFIIETDEGKYFQSYETIIVFKPKYSLLTGDKIQLDKNYWDYSTTTGKYRNQFLGETKKETEKKIKSGEYLLVDLNS